jgi:hypothetical protein
LGVFHVYKSIISLSYDHDVTNNLIPNPILILKKNKSKNDTLKQVDFSKLAYYEVYPMIDNKIVKGIGKDVLNKDTHDLSWKLAREIDSFSEAAQKLDAFINLQNCITDYDCLQKCIQSFEANGVYTECYMSDYNMKDDLYRFRTSYNAEQALYSFQ